jgi:hypothetical protein
MNAVGYPIRCQYCNCKSCAIARLAFSSSRVWLKFRLRIFWKRDQEPIFGTGKMKNSKLIPAIILPFFSLIPLSLKINKEERFVSLSSPETQIADVSNSSNNFPGIAGPLRVLSSNRKYFTDDGRRAVYLTGSHTWSDLQDMDAGANITVNNRNSCSNPTECFAIYLNWVKGYGHNFIRLWRAEHTANANSTVSPHPWARTGPGNATDGKPKFNLDQFDQNYFDRLRSRAIQAGNAGFCVSIMLFDEGGAENSIPWDNNPFNAKNNINGIDGNLSGYRLGIGTHTLQSSAVVAKQDVYIKKVVDTVNDLDNVMYEVANESPTSIEWQNHVADLIHNYESSKAKQHLVGMNAGGGHPAAQVNNTSLLSSHADWISPNAEGGYRNDPPPASGLKIIISDTDHLWGVGGDRVWVWKSFTRGLNTIYMDPYYLSGFIADEGVRWAMGDTLSYARRMNLAAMNPSPSGCSTAYCLINPGEEYLVYNPGSGNVTIKNLPAGTYRYEWFNTVSRATSQGSTQTVSAGNFTPSNSPDGSGNVLYLKKVRPSPSPPP